MAIFKSLIQSPKGQRAFLLIWIAVASAWLLVSDQSMIAYLMLLCSLLIVYRMREATLHKVIAAVIILGVLLPLLCGDNRNFMEVTNQIGIYVGLALGLNIVVGFTGLLDLGYVAFFAAGAYMYAIFATSQASNFISSITFPLDGTWFWPFLIIGLIVAAILGVLLGLPVLRMKGDYLAIVTLGFGEIIRIVLNNMDKPINITNGPKGLTPISQPKILGFTLSSPFHFYFLILAVVFIIIVIVKRLENSRLGRSWVAIREDDLAAQSVGIPLLRMKLLAFAFGASFAGVIGAIFAAKQMYIDPTSFVLLESVGILVMVVLGGSGSVAGVILGAVLVSVLQLQLLKEFSIWLNSLRDSGILSLPVQLDPSKFQRLIFGLLLVLVALFKPNGLIPATRKKFDLSYFSAQPPGVNASAKEGERS